MDARQGVVLSTDVGNEIDDQWAITHLLLELRFDVLGILSAHAPTLPAPSARHTYQVLVDAVENRLGIRNHPPLIEGSSLPLAGPGEPRSSAASEFLVEAARGFSSDHRLTVLAIGPATDVASAILADPAIAERIRVIQMAFESEAGGDIFNVLNDPYAEQVILDSHVPLTLGPADVCRRDLAMHFSQARALLAGRGRAGRWLWEEFQDWYDQHIKPPGREDRAKPHPIWDEIVIAHALGLTTTREGPRPHMRPDATFSGTTAGTVSWITSVDSERVWARFAALLKET